MGGIKIILLGNFISADDPYSSFIESKKHIAGHTEEYEVTDVDFQFTMILSTRTHLTHA